MDELARAVEDGDRSALARAITVIESRRPQDQERAARLLAALAPRAGGAVRVGISGPPGVGKSTLIDALGRHLIAAGHRVAVLAVDPSSRVSGGSILGDKTRMEHLARADRAFVRPSPGGGVLGGVARHTRETVLLCEAAGHDVVLVETIGVGQSEVAVADLVDTVVLLVQPGSGDELQGIKRGVTELADVVFVNKADGDGRAAALATRADYDTALQLLHADRGTVPAVLVGSAATGDGVEALWREVLAHRAALGEDGRAARRRDQALRALDAALGELALERFLADADARRRLDEARVEVAAGRLPPTVAARRVLAADGGAKS